jgi:cold shock CspA family protein
MAAPPPRDVFRRTPGVFRHFNQERGFGFITGEDGRDYWAHAKNVVGEFKPLTDDLASFIPDTDKLGRLFARQIVITGS